MRLHTLTVYLTGLTAFFLGLSYFLLFNQEQVIWNALVAVLILAAVGGCSYALLSALIPSRAAAPAAESSPGINVLLAGAVVTTVAAAMAFVTYVETSASLELLWRLLDPNYVPTTDSLGIRLSTVFMPFWAQFLFEVGRRFALPLTMMLLLSGAGSPVLRAWLYATVGLCGFIFVFGTLDRVIPLMYIAVLYAFRFQSQPRNVLRDRWFYASAVIGVVVIGVFRVLQYGDFHVPPSGLNGTVSEYLEHAMPSDHPVTGALANEIPAIGDDHAPAEKSAVGTRDPLPASEDEDRDNDAEHRAATVETGGFIADNEVRAQQDVEGGYLYFLLVSTINRVVLSPFAMTIYAFESYNSTNYLHWSATRVLSLIGIGHYVGALEEGSGTRFHDAFPVTMIGDLWRNGGFVYMPFYSVLIGAYMLLLDRTFFRTRQLAHWQAFSIVGMLYLFYGNALNATMLLFTGGSLACHLFVIAYNHFAKPRIRHPGNLPYAEE